ncbi:S8 family serine peptidase [Chitinophaga sp. YR627]|uniref:S8 family serine peptidase n=1 Tax=Chitinophaga sp. YR627 TaxID=1881041 RepID=UPI000A82B07A|nr:S8 family serine peptidase [Chitinophaga sp. YR627]
MREGTSSATPQVAAAAALYYQKYYDALSELPEPWMRVEAIRAALFNSARKHIKEGYGEPFTYYGNGILQAKAMLEQPVPLAADLQKQERDTVSFPFFRLILGTKSLTEEEDAQSEMLETELMQLVMSNKELQQILQDEEIAINDLPDEQLQAFINTVLMNTAASDTLKRHMLNIQDVLL